jgi:hypothetical protein
MTTEQYDRLHEDLGFAFSEYVTSHLESPLLAPLTDATAVVFQTDDPDFNAHELESAQRARACDDKPDRPVTLIYVPVPQPPSVDGVDWGRAKVLARFVIKPEPMKTRTTV